MVSDFDSPHLPVACLSCELAICIQQIYFSYHPLVVSPAVSPAGLDSGTCRIYTSLAKGPKSDSTNLSFMPCLSVLGEGSKTAVLLLGHFSIIIMINLYTMSRGI